MYFRSIFLCTHVWIVYQITFSPLVVCYFPLIPHPLWTFLDPRLSRMQKIGCPNPDCDSLWSLNQVLTIPRLWMTWSSEMARVTVGVHLPVLYKRIAKRVCIVIACIKAWEIVTAIPKQIFINLTNFKITLHRSSAISRRTLSSYLYS